MNRGGLKSPPKKLRGNNDMIWHEKEDADTQRRQGEERRVTPPVTPPSEERRTTAAPRASKSVVASSRSPDTGPSCGQSFSQDHCPTESPSSKGIQTNWWNSLHCTALYTCSHIQQSEPRFSSIKQQEPLTRSCRRPWAESKGYVWINKSLSRLFRSNAANCFPLSVSVGSIFAPNKSSPRDNSRQSVLLELKPSCWDTSISCFWKGKETKEC